jgi:hypothetical protein
MFIGGNFMFNFFIRKKLAARERRQDGTDRGFAYLHEGVYVAKPRTDGYLEIFRPEGEPLYLMALIFNEKLSSGEISLMNESMS